MNMAAAPNRRIGNVRGGAALAAVFALAASAACHHRSSSSMAACEPASNQVASEMSLDLLNGSFQVAFVATDGPRTGQSVGGLLTLHPQDAGLVSVASADPNTSVSQPTIGRLDLALDSIGATRMGDTMADSNTMPGVGLYVTRLPGGAVTGVVGRVGSGANARGSTPFDAGYFTLFIQRVNGEGIWGTWRSSPGPGGLVIPEARGHFCAMRTAQR